MAFVEQSVPLEQQSRGEVELIAEQPQAIRLRATMETPGLLVLSELWFEGWTAEVAGAELPVHRVNYGLRGVHLPEGVHEIEFRYESTAFSWGVVVFLVTMVIMAGSFWYEQRRSRSA